MATIRNNETGVLKTHSNTDAIPKGWTYHCWENLDQLRGDSKNQTFKTEGINHRITTNVDSTPQGMFIAHMQGTYTRCVDLARAKNNDYAGEDGLTPFANFEACELVEVPTPRGILVRLMDKIKRISNLLDQEAKVTDESIDDTICDAINYLAILRAYRYLQTKEPNA